MHHETRFSGVAKFQLRAALSEREALVLLADGEVDFQRALNAGCGGAWCYQEAD